MTNEVIIKVEDLVKNFGSLHVLKGINEVIHQGEVVSIIGPSGSGKSTFIRCLNLLEKPTSGKIIVEVDGSRSGNVDVGVRSHIHGSVSADGQIAVDGTLGDDIFSGFAVDDGLVYSGSSELCKFVGDSCIVIVVSAVEGEFVSLSGDIGSRGGRCSVNGSVNIQHILPESNGLGFFHSRDSLSGDGECQVGRGPVANNECVNRVNGYGSCSVVGCVSGCSDLYVLCVSVVGERSTGVEHDLLVLND